RIHDKQALPDGHAVAKLQGRHQPQVRASTQHAFGRRSHVDGHVRRLTMAPVVAVRAMRHNGPRANVNPRHNGWGGPGQVLTTEGTNALAIWYRRCSTGCKCCSTVPVRRQASARGGPVSHDKGRNAVLGHLVGTSESM